MIDHTTVNWREALQKLDNEIRRRKRKGPPEHFKGHTLGWLLRERSFAAFQLKKLTKPSSLPLEEKMKEELKSGGSRAGKGFHRDLMHHMCRVLHNLKLLDYDAGHQRKSTPDLIFEGNPKVTPYWTYQNIDVEVEMDARRHRPRIIKSIRSSKNPILYVVTRRRDAAFLKDLLPSLGKPVVPSIGDFHAPYDATIFIPRDFPRVEGRLEKEQTEMEAEYIKKLEAWSRDRERLGRKRLELAHNLDWWLNRGWHVAFKKKGKNFQVSLKKAGQKERYIGMTSDPVVCLALDLIEIELPKSVTKRATELMTYLKTRPSPPADQPSFFHL